MASDLKDNLTARETWVRLPKIILFALIFRITELVIALVVVAQFLVRLGTGRPNERLRAFGRALGCYCYQMAAFLCQHTDQMPYPFAAWPAGPLGDPVAELPAPRPPPAPEPEPGSEPAAAAPPDGPTRPARARPRRSGKAPAAAEDGAA